LHYRFSQSTFDEPPQRHADGTRGRDGDTRMPGNDAADDAAGALLIADAFADLVGVSPNAVGTVLNW